MCLVRLPPSLYKELKDVDYSVAEKIQNILYHKYNIEVSVMRRTHPRHLIGMKRGGRVLHVVTKNFQSNLPYLVKNAVSDESNLNKTSC